MKKYFCRTCRGLRNQKEIHRVKRIGEEDEGYLQWTTTYSILECLGCETISFLETYGDSSMIIEGKHGEPVYYDDEIIYPPYLRNGNEITSFFLPEPIRSIYKETISAFKSDSSILTAGGLRAIIEAICNHLKIKKGELAIRINLLHEKGHLTLSESKRLHSIRFLGNDALHEIEKPKKTHLYILLEIVNHLLANLFINDKKMKGQLETIIDKYEDFLHLIRNKINNDLVGKEYTLTQILGKSKRLILKVNIKTFEDILKDEIKKGKIDYLSISNESEQSVYNVLKQPEFSFIW